MGFRVVMLYDICMERCRVGAWFRHSRRFGQLRDWIAVQEDIVFISREIYTNIYHTYLVLCAAVL